LLAVFIIIPLNNCFASEPVTDIEGLWIGTEETAMNFLSGTQKAVLQIKQNQNGEYIARGIFLWNGDYQSEWELSSIQYDKSTQALTIVDADQDTFKSVIDRKSEMITGAVHLKDKTKNPLNFLRADKNLENKLFHPRIPDKNGKVTYSYKKPIQLDDGLKTASVDDEQIDSEAFTHLIKEIINQKYGRMESILILKDNKLIVEEYFYGYDRSQLHKIHSCTKSITSLLLGIALGHHKNILLNQPLFDFFPQYDSLKTKEKEDITLKHALTMTAGLNWNEFPKEMYETKDWFQFILSLPMGNKPGEKFLYNSGLSILLGGIINHLEGKNAQVYAEEFLFGPLGINRYDWESHSNGTPQCGGGLSMLPRDMAKIGLLLLNDGKWQNKQLVPKEWITQSTRPYVAESEYFDYGYQWWHRSKNNQKWWNDPKNESTEELDMVVALGWGGQRIIVVKDINLVIVTTASNFDNKKELSTFPMVIEKIIPAISNTK